MAAMTVDECIRAEQFKIAQLIRLGLSRYEAICAVESGCDWHELEQFVDEHPDCPIELEA